MEDRRNYYRVLHLQPDAPIERVRVNYRTLMQKLGAPGPGIPGRVIDLSPTGMSCETSAPLDPNDVLKIASHDFDAIGSVAHARRTGALTLAGLRFLTVHFPQIRGNFGSLEVWL